MADVNFTSLFTSLITCHLVAQRVFTSMTRIMQSVNRGLACRIPCCRSQSRLFSASVVNVREAHKYMRAIQPCNTHLFYIVVTSWHYVLHHKLAIQPFIANLWCSTQCHDVTTMQYAFLLHGCIARVYSWVTRTFAAEAENSPFCHRQHGLRQANPRFACRIIRIIEVNTRCATSDVNTL